MTLDQTCDLVYALLVDSLERWVLAEHNAAVTILAAGGELPLPNMVERREEFDAALVAPFTRVDAKDAALREAVGLRGR